MLSVSGVVLFIKMNQIGAKAGER